MKPDPTPIDELIARHLPSAPPHHVEAAGVRVWQRLRTADPSAATPLETRLDVSGLSTGRRWPRTLGTYAAAAAVVALAVGAAVLWPSAGVAVLEAADSSVYRVTNGTSEPITPGATIGRDDAVRADGGAVLRLADGSHVEMRSMSELSVERGGEGLGIRLRSGSIIVTAKQDDRPLYVKTKDMTASVTGTVALVKADDEGSRVGVIEGEAQIREGGVETRLRPGEQVATNRAVPARPLSEELAWSRNAPSHQAILAAFEQGMAATAAPIAVPRVRPAVTAPGGQSAPRLEFDAASVKPCDQNSVPAPPAGARGGGPNSVRMTPGHTYVLCVTAATLVRTAYGYAPADVFTDGGRARGFNYNNVYGLGVEDGRRVRGGPDWVRNERFTIDAVAPDDTDIATMTGPMLRALLEKRFGLAAHLDSEQIPAFDLVVAPGGLKIKEGTCVRSDAPAPLMRSTLDLVRKNLDAARRGATTADPCGLAIARNGPNWLMVAAGSSLPPLSGTLNAPVLNRTGVSTAARFNYVLEFAADDAFAGPLARAFTAGANDAADDPSAVAPAPNLFTAIEEQLGLRLVPTRAPREFIVIDHIERPSAN